MVKLTEVEDAEDEHFTQQRAYHEDDDQYSDTSSSVTDDGNDNDGNVEESLYDRIIALKDMIPPRQRAAFSSGFSKAYGLIGTGLTMGGATLWVLVTSTFVLGVPFAVAVGEEQQLLEMEKDMKTQQFTTDSITPGAQTIHLEPQRR